MDWITQYSTALGVRDAREQVHKPYIDAYTKLADRTAALSDQPAPAAFPSSPTPSNPRAGTPTKKDGKPSSAPAPSDLLASLRADLGTTQKARSILQTQLENLNQQLLALASQQKSSQSQIAVLTKQRIDAERKLRDRDEELRGKGKLVEQAHDDIVALEIQTNLAQQKSEKLEKENLELVQRWMARMGEEAEKVNRDSKWE